MGQKKFSVALAGLAMMGFGIAAEVEAACSDPAGPGVNWRRCYQDGRDLSNVDLTGAELRDATFQRSTLNETIFDEVDAYRAKFISADIIGASFRGARLTEADFTRSDLTGTDFTDADLRNARLINTTLVEVNFTGARLGSADLRNADLSGATWIDGERTCREGSIGQCN